MQQNLLLEVIKLGAKAWSHWRLSNLGVNPDLTNIILSEIDLTGYNFSNCNLNSAKFSECTISDCNFSGSSLITAIFSNTKFLRTNFQNSRLDCSIFYNAEIENCDFSEANLSSSSLEQVQISSSLFVKSVLNSIKISFSGIKTSQLNHSNFDCADLMNMSIISSELRESRFVSCLGNEVHFIYSNFINANFSDAYLEKSHWTECALDEFSFKNAIVSRSRFYKLSMKRAVFLFSKIKHSSFERVDLSYSEFSSSTIYSSEFVKSNLRSALFLESNIDHSTFNACSIYGISIWGMSGVPKEQKDLIISGNNNTSITVDDLEMAQFVYLLIKYEKVRKVLDTVTSKVVLILGNFNEKRKPVLEAIRDQLRLYNLTPILFDFKTPDSKDKTATVETLARMSRFIIADLTDPSCVPHELASIVPNLRTTPILTFKQLGTSGYSMFNDYKAYPWVLDTHEYENKDSLISDLPKLIEPANQMANRFRSG